MTYRDCLAVGQSSIIFNLHDTTLSRFIRKIYMQKEI